MKTILILFFLTCQICSLSANPNSGGVLTITSQIDMHPLATINIMNGGKLIINGGRIVRSKIIVNNGGKLDVKNHGELNCKNGDNIFVKLGGLCNFEANPTINL